MRMKEEKSRNKSRGRKQMWNKVIKQIRGDNENWIFNNQYNLRKMYEQIGR